MAIPADDEIVARYGSLYQGDDELAANCLIKRNGQCVRLFQGLAVVGVTSETAPRELLDRLLEILEQPIPASWAKSSYAGYNFITDPEEANGGEIAVYGERPGEVPGYYVPPDGDEIAALVKQIAALEPVAAAQ